MKIKYYNQEGAEAGELKLDERIFNLPWNAELVHQVMVSMMSNSRVGIAHAKGRGEVRGGGKKPWKQKGLGRARQGSIRSPIWVGGGVTHGPLKEKNYKKKINKKMSQKAFFSGLSKKLKDNEILVMDKIDIGQTKTKTAKLILNNIKNVEGYTKIGEKGGKALVCLENREMNAILSFRNLAYAKAKEARNLNLMDLLTNKFIILTKEAVKNLEKKVEK